MAPLVFPWETTAPGPAPGAAPIAAAPRTVDLEVQSATVNIVAGAYTLLRPASKKRRWMVVQNAMETAPGVNVIVAATLGPANIVARSTFVQLQPGDSCIFSETGDMPWKGPVYALGQNGNPTVYWSEAQEWPIE